MPTQNNTNIPPNTPVDVIIRKVMPYSQYMDMREKYIQAGYFIQAYKPQFANPSHGKEVPHE